MNSPSRYRYHTSRNKRQRGRPSRCQAENPSQANNYVRSWLAQVSNPSLDPEQNPSQHFDEDRDDREITSHWHPFNLPVLHIARQFPPETRNTLTHPPTDLSSFRKSRESRKQHQLDSEIEQIHDGYNYKEKKRRRQPSSDETSCPSNSDASAYTKQPRHKTRQDRYDTKKQKGGRNSTSEKKRNSSKKQKRAQIRSGRDVMSNFVSDAVSNKRVTVSMSSGREVMTAGLV